MRTLRRTAACGRLWPLCLPFLPFLLLAVPVARADCGLDACPGVGDCCTANGSPGCDDETCCVSVCLSVSSCCSIAWDDFCATIAAKVCAACGGTPAPPGACCLPDESCVVAGAVDCLGSGGCPSSPGSNCQVTPCTVSACCFQDGACVALTFSGCIIRGGIFLGGGAECSACPTQACCLPDGTCVDVIPGPPGFPCVSQDGETQGFGSSCAAVTCEVLTEACCLPDGTCEDLPLRECLDAGGAPGGPGTFCKALGPAVCLVTGACCESDGVCLPRPPGECAAVAGVYQGDGTECAEVACDPFPVGACCFETGGCDIRPEPLCDEATGFFAGPGTTCEEIFCFPPAACCFEDGSCAELQPVYCLAQGGLSRFGPCDDFICAAAVKCCFPDGTCDIIAPGACGANGGAEFLGTCSGDPCPSPEQWMACCLPAQLPCVVLIVTTCSTLGGLPTGSCEEDDCDEGACCFPQASCEIATAVRCAAIAGEFQGAGTVCVDAGGPICLPGDVNGDGVVNVVDLVLVIKSWGPCAGCAADLTGDGIVGVGDLVLVILGWGG